MLNYLLQSLGTLCSFTGIMYILIGSVAGLLFGSLPGLSGGTIMVLLLPISYKMDPVLAMALFMSIHIGSTCGGCIGSILLGIPGTSGSIATTWDGYEFTKQGDPVRALSAAVVCNFIGTIPSILIAMAACRTLANLGVKLGPWEYAAMCFCAVCMVIGLSKGNMVKGFVGVGLAVLIASIGTDPINGSVRLTFGSMDMYSGINVINIMLGLYAAKLILLEYARRSRGAKTNIKVRRFKWPGKDLKDNIGNMIRSFVTGAFIGFLPGLGAPTSTVIAYANEKSLAKDSEKWGHGAIGGVIAPEICNNAGIGGAMIPMLALGIPGDAIMVQFMAVMSIHGITSGPMLMKTNPDMVYMLFTAAMVAAVFVLLVQTLGMPMFPKFISFPYHYLYPAIIVVSFLGSYMTAGSIFGVIVTVCACALGLAMDYFDIPIMPFIMTYILASLFEKNVRQAMNFSLVGVQEFFTRPVSLIFIIAGVAVLGMHFVKPLISKVRE